MNELNVLRSNKLNRIKKINDSRKNNMNIGKKNKLDLESMITKLPDNYKKIYNLAIKNIDIINLTKVYHEIRKYINNSLSEYSIITAYVKLILNNNPDLTLPIGGIVICILNTLESMKYKIKSNEKLLFETKLECKMWKNVDYSKFIYQINAYWNYKIPCGCPVTCCKCEGYMDNEVKQLNRCISCTPFLSMQTTGYSCKALYAQKIYNKITIHQTSNPRLGICSFCMANNIILKNKINDKLKNKDENVSDNVINLKLLFQRSLIPTNIHYSTEIDVAIDKYWQGRKRYNDQTILYGDAPATKIWSTMKILNNCSKDIRSNKMNIIKFTYEVQKQTKEKMNVDLIDVNKYQKLDEEDETEDEDEEMNDNETGFNSEIEGWIDGTDEIIGDKYSLRFATRTWLIDKKEKILEMESWTNEELRKSKQFKDYNKKYHSNFLTNGEYDPMKDEEYLNHAYPCINTTNLKNKDFKQFILRCDDALYHVVLIIRKITENNILSINVIDTNEKDDIAENKFKKKFLQKTEKHKQQWKKIDYNFIYLNINNSNWIQMFKEKIDNRINEEGFCDTLSNLILKKILNHLNELNKLKKNDEFKSKLNELIINQIVIPLKKFKNLDLTT